jgi:hypothetical protein
VTAEDNIIHLIIEIRHFFEDLNEGYLKPFLADWPLKTDTTRSVSPNSLPVLSYLPAHISCLLEVPCHANGNNTPAGPLSLARRQPGPEITFYTITI